MKNKIILLLILILTFLMKPLDIKAASATISVSSSTSSAIVGNKINISVTVSSSAALGSWSFDLKYDSSKVRLDSSSFGGTYIAEAVTSQNQKSKTYNFSFTAKASGNAYIYIANAGVIGWDEKEMSVSSGSRTIKIITQQQLEASYSKNNYLKELSIEGATLSPEFNKDTLEYNVELEPNTEKIKINAQVEDSKSTITGTGEVTVTEGDNKLEVVVTAQNGNQKTYVIKAKVKELSPIEVTIDGKKYTVVRKKEALTIPSTYQETTITLNEEEIPAFTSDITKYTLIGLKDEEGNINLYIYNDENNTYILYNELSLNKVILYPIPNNNIKVPKGYVKTETTINNIKITGYQYKKGSEFILIYGMNVETGKEDLYVYDEKEKTFQRYNSDEIEIKDKEINNFLYLLIGVSSLSILLIIIIIIITVNFNKNIKKLKQLSFKNDIDSFN